MEHLKSGPERGMQDSGPASLSAGQQVVCDLILLSWNHLEETQACLRTLFETVRTPSRLFIVDNGSEPAVRAFLAGVRPAGVIQDVILLQNEANEGFSGGMNRGLSQSSAPFTCLLNNDLRFTEGWLEEMLWLAQDPSVGLVNPASNTFGHRPARGQSFDAYWRALRERRGTCSEVGMAIGFCLLLRRDVLARIGLLTEDVNRCFFEDEDYSMRAVAAGLRCVVAEGAYVHHTEHASVRHVPEREALFAQNQAWCNERWGRRLRVAWPRFTTPVPGSAELRAWLTRLLAWARRRNHVYVYCPMPPGKTPEALFRSVNLSPHSDLHWFAVPRALARLEAVRAIVSRQRKPFDIIVAPEPGWGRVVRSLSWLHRAAVSRETDQEGLEDLWRQRSRSPSSS